MRPLKLTISAFEAYKNKTIIDFSKIGKEGIYLITGDTGAGKTTIFDAITMALYGKLSGENRDIKNVRCKYSDKQADTFINFEFEIRGRIYNVTRYPKCIRPSKKGDGFTDTKAGEDTLIMPDRSVITGSDINKKIIELMGIDYNQFKQIAMLPQGEFLKLLLSESNEKEKIFRSLFSTEYYNELNERLKDENSKYKNKYDNQISEIEGYISSVICTNNEKNEINCLNTSKTIEFLEKKNESTKIKIDKLTELFDENNDRKTKYNILLSKINDVKNIEKKLEESKAFVKRSEEFLKEYEVELLKAKSLEDKKTKIVERIALIRGGLEKYEVLKNNQDLLDKNIKNNKEYIELKTADENDYKELLFQLENEQKIFESLSDSETKYNNLKFENEKIETVKSEIESLLAEIEKYKDLIKSFDNIKKKYKAQSLKSEKLNIEFNTKNKIYLDEQAGILALNLKEGMPCPVCGSKEHPFTAELSNGAPTKAELDKLKDNRDKEQEKTEKLSAECSKYIGSIEQLKNVVIQNTIKFDESCSGVEDAENVLNIRLDEINIKIKNLSSEIDKASNDYEKYKKLNKEIPEKQKKITELQNKIDEYDKNIIRTEGEINKHKEVIVSLKKELEFESKDKAILEINNLEETVRNIDNNIDKCQKDYDECNLDIKKGQGEISAYENEIKNNKPEEMCDLEEINNSLEIINQKEKEYTQRLECLKNEYSFNTNLCISIRKSYDAIKKTEKKYIMIKKLYALTSGNIKDQTRIKLESYVQSLYFDRIVARANKRLSIMTNGQYELVRELESNSKQKKFGLGLNVVDHWTGTQRAVNTLSGGESFKAALALALGLTDEIKSRSGGVSLDAMFIDEGFGSLDDESLSQAVRALTELASNDKTIGIISHIKELKNKIDKQLVVKKDRQNGSRVEIIVD